MIYNTLSTTKKRGNLQYKTFSLSNVGGRNPSWSTYNLRNRCPKFEVLNLPTSVNSPNKLHQRRTMGIPISFPCVLDIFQSAVRLWNLHLALIMHEIEAATSKESLSVELFCGCTDAPERWDSSRGKTLADGGTFACTSGWIGRVLPCRKKTCTYSRVRSAG